MEPERRVVLAGERMDELLAVEVGRGGRRPSSGASRGRAPRPRRSGEDEPDDRRRVDDRPLLAGQVVEAGGEQGMDRRRHDDLAGAARVLADHRDHLLDVERVALGRGDRPVSRVSAGSVGVPEEAIDHRLDVGGAERLEIDPLDVRLLGPVGVLVEQLRPRRADDEDRRAPGPTSTRCSRKSRNVSSAQWMSSMTTTSGRSAASDSRSRRAPQKSSATGNDRADEADRGGDALDDRVAVGSARRSQAGDLRAGRLGRVVLGDPRGLPDDLGSGQNVMPSPYARQRPRRTVASRADAAG